MKDIKEIQKLELIDIEDIKRKLKKVELIELSKQIFNSEEEILKSLNDMISKINNNIVDINNMKTSKKDNDISNNIKYTANELLMLTADIIDFFNINKEVATDYINIKDTNDMIEKNYMNISSNLESILVQIGKIYKKMREIDKILELKIYTDDTNYKDEYKEIMEVQKEYVLKTKKIYSKVDDNNKKKKKYKEIKEKYANEDIKRGHELKTLGYKELEKNFNQLYDLIIDGYSKIYNIKYDFKNKDSKKYTAIDIFKKEYNEDIFFENNSIKILEYMKMLSEKNVEILEPLKKYFAKHIYSANDENESLKMLDNNRENTIEKIIFYDYKYKITKSILKLNDKIDIDTNKRINNIRKNLTYHSIYDIEALKKDDITKEIYNTFSILTLESKNVIDDYIKNDKLIIYLNNLNNDKKVGRTSRLTGINFKYILLTRYNDLTFTHELGHALEHEICKQNCISKYGKQKYIDFKYDSNIYNRHYIAEIYSQVAELIYTLNTIEKYNKTKEKYENIDRFKLIILEILSKFIGVYTNYKKYNLEFKILKHIIEGKEDDLKLNLTEEEKYIFNEKINIKNKFFKSLKYDISMLIVPSIVLKIWQEKDLPERQKRYTKKYIKSMYKKQTMNFKELLKYLEVPIYSKKVREDFFNMFKQILDIYLEIEK